MSGKYLLDTCFIIALQKHQTDALNLISSKQIQLHQCYYSVISRLELLSYPNLNQKDDEILQRILASMTCINLDDHVQKNTIKIRKAKSVKLPDSIILATAISHDLELLTFDLKMQKISQIESF